MTNDEYWDEKREEAKRDQPERVKVFRCGDRTCGGLDCASCYGEQAARQYVASEQEQEEAE